MRKQRLIVMVLDLMMSLLFITGATVDYTRKCSLLVHLVSADKDEIYSGVEVEVIMVASADENGFTYLSSFASMEKDVDSFKNDDYIETLTRYADSNKLTGTRKTTDNEGKALFDDLKPGLYLIRTTSTDKDAPYFSPFLSVLPSNDGYDVTATPKTVADSSSRHKRTELKVRKVWNDDGTQRPSSIKVELWSEDGLYETVTLDEKNNWEYEWKGLKSKYWYVKEKDIPAGYTVTYFDNGTEYRITNTAKLIQTGQLKWPVPALFVGGMLLISAGFILKISEKKRQDEK